jgi:hypothetical protein
MTAFDCDRARHCIDEQLDGTLTGDDREALDVHLDVCPACRDLHDGWAGIESVMRGAPLPPLDAATEQRILAGGDAAATRGRPRRRRRPLWWAGAIAGVIVLTAWGAPRLLAPPAAPAAPDEAEAPTTPPPEPFVEQVPPAGPPPLGIDSHETTHDAPPELALVEPAPRVATHAGSDPLVAPGTALDAAHDQAPPTLSPVLAALEAGRLDEARELALVEVERRPDSPRTIDMFAHLAQEHRRARRYDDACAIYGQLIDTWPDSAAATNSHVALGQVRQGALGQPAASLMHFDDYLAAAPSGVLAEEARVGRVRALAELDRREELVASATEYLALHPRGAAAPEVLALRGDALRRAGLLGVAAEDYRRVLERWPGSPFAAQARTGLDACGEGM